MDEIRYYTGNDMARVGCHDCEGCSSCCQGMGDTVWLDPYDIWQLTNHLGLSFEELLQQALELHVEDGLILPNLKMHNDGNLACIFLNDKGRCNIHDFRPGYCRLFPLGRNYSERGLEYFLLEDACPAEGKTKVKVSKWLQIEKLPQYEAFLKDWHAITKRLRRIMGEFDLEGAREINMKFLQLFYLSPYGETDFYGQIAGRIKTWREATSGIRFAEDQDLQ